MPFQKEGEVLPEWNYFEAIIHYCLSNLSTTKTTDLLGEGGCFPMPDYEKGLKRSTGISNNEVKNFFGHQVNRAIKEL